MIMWFEQYIFKSTNIECCPSDNMIVQCTAFIIIVFVFYLCIIQIALIAINSLL